MHEKNKNTMRCGGVASRDYVSIFELVYEI